MVGASLQVAAEAEGWVLRVATLVVATRGDAALGESLRALGSGAFTQEVDDAVQRGDADVAVHSLKDAPPSAPHGLVLAACLAREDVRDAVVLAAGHACLGDLPAGSKVGTSSMRRRAQLLSSYPSLEVVPLRGSVQARVAALEAGELSATVVALAGLKRLGQKHIAGQVLGTHDMLPAACQGTIGVMCREGDTRTRRLLACVCHMPTLLEVTAERACLRALMGTASVMPPVAVAALATARLHHGGDDGTGGRPATDTAATDGATAAAAAAAAPPTPAAVVAEAEAAEAEAQAQAAASTAGAEPCPSPSSHLDLEFDCLIASPDGRFLHRRTGSCRCDVSGSSGGGTEEEQQLAAAGALGERYGRALAEAARAQPEPT
ncbi:hypothetical protein FOA52_010018 [Chlamydomonas sp. UWO 241]|nr:hypothetical protein FOA52_010018 [Chlamydomonas sp. UWO 241]